MQSWLVPTNAALIAGWYRQIKAGWYRQTPPKSLVGTVKLKLVGTDKRCPNCWLVRANAKLVGTDKCRPNCWLVPSNANTMQQVEMQQKQMSGERNQIETKQHFPPTYLANGVSPTTNPVTCKKHLRSKCTKRMSNNIIPASIH